MLVSLPLPLLLLSLWAALLFGAFIFGRSDTERNRRMPTWTRIGSSLVLIVLAWALALDAQGTAAAGYAVLIAVGMTLGFVGDLFMARLIPVGQHVIGGIAAFGLGHIAYIAALLQLGGASGLDATGPRFGAWLVWLAIGAVGWYIVVWRGAGERGLMHRAALPYALVLASTAGLATGLALQDGRFWTIAIGAALFLLSDLILAGELFAGLRFRLIGDVVWLTYGPAQMLIVLSITTARALLG